MLYASKLNTIEIVSFYCYCILSPSRNGCNLPKNVALLKNFANSKTANLNTIGLMKSILCVPNLKTEN